ncbi:hypothetical protein BIY28_10775 [Brenneria goodwinii]|nr:hypothetical protein BIY28_10775 [Brenneria goodwinii]
MPGGIFLSGDGAVCLSRIGMNRTALTNPAPAPNQAQISHKKSAQMTISSGRLSDRAGCLLPVSA